MKKAIIISSLIFLAVLVLSESGVFNSLLIFLLIGAVPGTSISLSPNAMFLIIGAVGWVVVCNLTTVKMIDMIKTKRLVKHTTKRQQRMPKRRYSRI
jgi:NADH:ubiquinone oxidoreductase subunit 6 (subunit J)